MISELDENWTNGAWVNYVKYTYIYDDSGNLLSEIDASWNNTSWINFCRYSYTYESGNQLSELSEVWSNNAWTNYERNSYTYNNSGNRATSLNEVWNGGNWMNSNRATYTYDNSGETVTLLLEFWDNYAWLVYGRYTNTYDILGNLVNELYETWSPQAGWENYRKRIYSFDTSGNSIHGENFIWENNTWIQKKDYLEVYYNNGNNCILVYSKYFDAEYSPSTGIKNEELTAKNFSLEQNYPNPFNPSTKIKFSLSSYEKINLSVYDMLGRKVSTILNEEKEPGEHEVNFNSYGLASGVYIYRITAGQYSNSKSMVILK